MALEYEYGIYNYGQYPKESKAAMDAMVEDGWQVHTASPNYSELYVLWRRELPAEDADGRKTGGRRRAEQEKKDA